MNHVGSMPAQESPRSAVDDRIEASPDSRLEASQPTVLQICAMPLDEFDVDTSRRKLSHDLRDRVAFAIDRRAVRVVVVLNAHG